jgi:hypothetical protein
MDNPNTLNFPGTDVLDEPLVGFSTWVASTLCFIDVQVYAVPVPNGKLHGKSLLHRNGSIVPLPFRGSPEIGSYPHGLKGRATKK